MKNYIIYIFLFLFYFTSLSASATSYAWNGGTSSAWNTLTNWTPNGIPTTGDNVTITDVGSAPHLDTIRTIANLTMSSGALDLDGNTLTLSGTGTFNGGTISDGLIKPNGSVTNFHGTTFSCSVNSTSAQIKFNGGTFNNSVVVDQNSSTSSTGDGGCTFNSTLTINKSGSNTMRFGNLYPDIFNGVVTVNNTNNGQVAFAYTASGTQFNANVILNNTNPGDGVSFGTNGGTSTLASGKTITIGTSGFADATLLLKNLTQSGTTAQEFNLSGTAVFNTSSSNFNGVLTVSSPNILCKSTTFNNSVIFTKSYNSTNYWDGGNIFNGSFSLTNTGGNSATIRPELTEGNIYNGSVTLSTTNGNIQMGYADSTEFNGDISINSNKITFNTNTGIVTYSGSNNQTISGSVAYAIDKLRINKSGGTLTLNTTLEIDSSITFENGYIISSSTYLVKLKAGSSVSGMSSASFINGPVRKTGNTSFIFPTGKDGVYMPIGINAPSSSTDAFTAEYFLDGFSHDGELRASTLSYVDANNYWNLDRTTGTSNVEVTLYWKFPFAFEFAGHVQIARWNGSTWIDEDSSAVSGNSANGSVKTPSALSSFGNLTFARANFSVSASCSSTSGITPDTYYTFDVETLLVSNPYSGFPYQKLYASNFTSPKNQAPSPTSGPTVGLDRPLSLSASAYSNGPNISSNVKSAGKVDNYLNLLNYTQRIFGPSTFEIGSNDYIAVEMIFRLNSDFMDQTSLQFFTLGTSTAYINADSIRFTTIVNPGSGNTTDNLVVAFDGTDRKSLGYYTDNNWHHIVFIYDASAGRKEIWIDGQLNDGFSKQTSGLIGDIVIPASEPGLSLCTPNSNSRLRFISDRDEIAIYVSNQLCGEEILEHYSDAILNGHHYNFGTFASGLSLESPLDLSGNFDPLDYPKNYTFSNSDEVCNECNIEVNGALEQLANFPRPRYWPSHTLHKNVNWLQSQYLGYENGAINNTLGYQIQDELALNWNYYYNLFQNFIQAPQILGPSNTFAKAFFNHAVAHSTIGYNFEYAILLYRKQLQYSSTIMSPTTVGPSDGDAWIYTNLIPNPELHYLSNYSIGSTGPYTYYNQDNAVAAGPTSWTPASPVSTYAEDGIRTGDYLEYVLTNNFPAITGFPRKIGFIGENNEITKATAPQSLTIPPLFNYGDYVSTDKTTLEGIIGPLTWPEYQGYRRMELDNTYRDEILGRTSIQSRIVDAPFLNYAVDGLTQFRYNYDQFIQTQKMPSSWNTNPYPTPDIYIRSPKNWKVDDSGPDDHGWLWLAISRKTELGPSYNHKRFAPFVSSGWFSREETNTRPTQWLGILKCMTLLGVDFFQPFHLNEGDIRSGKGYMYMAAMPSYAQAIASYYDDVLINGVPLEGDRTINNVSQSPIFPTYSFKAESPQNLVVAREYSAIHKFAISGTIQPSSNIEGSAPKESVAKINLNTTDRLIFNIRRQGSTYIYISPGSGTNDPIFYQLDKWHEFGHPERWSKNIDIEAEVIDNDVMPTSTAIETEGFVKTAGTPNIYDFTNANSYITYSSTPSDPLEYRFTPHERDIQSGNEAKYYLWVKARTKNTSGSSSVNIDLYESNGLALVKSLTLSCINSSDWLWYNLENCGVNPLLLTGSSTGLTQQEYILKIIANDADLELDEFILTREQNFRKYPDQTSCLVGSCCTASSITVSTGNGNTNSSYGPFSGTWTGNKVTINDDFTVNSDFIIDASNVIISSGKKITVQSGNTLTINNNSKLSACSGLWSKISVENGGILVIDNSLIENANQAIACNGGGQINLSNTIFDHNYSSVVVGGGTYSSSSITNCSFLCSGGNVGASPYNYHPGYHIYFAQAHNMPVEGCYFDEANIGIAALYSVLDIENCTFKNFQNYNGSTTQTNYLYGKAIYNANWGRGPRGASRSLAQSVIKDCEFINCKYGVHYEHTGVKVEGCKMDNVKTGVYAKGGHYLAEFEVTSSSIINSTRCIDLFDIKNYNVKIHDNVKLSVNSSPSKDIASAIVRASSFGTPAIPPTFEIYDNHDVTTNGWCGISISGINGGRIYNNTIYMNRPNFDYFSATQYGLRMHYCSNIRVSCNDFEGNNEQQLTGKTIISSSYSPSCVLQCNTLNLADKAIEIVGACDNSVIKGNLMYYLNYGIYIGNSDLGANGDCGNQLVDINDEAPGNRYEGTDDAGLFAESALYRYDPSVAPSAITFDVVSNTTGSNPTIYTPLTNNSNDPNALVNLSNVPTPFLCGGSCTPVLTHTDDFNNIKRTSYENIAKDTIIDTPEKLALDYQLKLKLYYELKNDEAKMDSSIILQNFFSSYLVTDKDNFFRVDSLIKIISDSTAQADTIAFDALITSAGDINENITSSSDVEENNKLINKIVLTTVLKDNYDLTHDEQEYVTNLAYQCPFVAGPAVYIARALYILINEEINFNDEDFCTSGSRHINTIADVISSVTNSPVAMSLIPNPANEQVLVSYKCNKLSTLRLTDITGKTLLLFNLTELEGQTRINSGNLAPGIYTVIITSESGQQTQKKLSIIR